MHKAVMAISLIALLHMSFKAIVNILCHFPTLPLP